MTNRRDDHLLLSLRDATPLVEAEIERARRYDRALAVIIVTGGDMSLFAARIPDLLVRLDRKRTMVVAPETDTERADVFAARLCAITGALVEGTAAFPGDGQSLASLMRAALTIDPIHLMDGVAR
ncbi:MAG: hypothetical protein RIB67_10710 [Miltoncostaeaceae bacterium]